MSMGRTLPCHVSTSGPLRWSLIISATVLCTFSGSAKIETFAWAMRTYSGLLLIENRHTANSKTAWKIPAPKSIHARKFCTAGEYRR